MKVLIPICAAVLLVAGCRTAREKMLAEGFDPAYVDGFIDGEHSGYNAAGNAQHPFVKDKRRYEADSLYRQGWDAGYARAKSSYKDVRRKDLTTSPDF